MDPLYRRAITQGVVGMAVFVAFIFVPAGTWHYWQGWLFIAVFSVSTIGFTVYLALYDRPLLERRMNAGPQHEKESSQKIIVSLIILAFLVFILLPPLDYRFGLSPVPAYLSLVGDVAIATSFRPLRVCASSHVRRRALAFHRHAACTRLVAYDLSCPAHPAGALLAPS